MIRQARRATSAVGERLAAQAVAADHAGRDPATLHPRWHQHVSELALPAGARSGWLRSFRLSERSGVAGDWPLVVELATATSFALCQLGRLGEIIPPPGSATGATPMVDLTRKVADPMLARVRQLLAQAESTSFDAEAEAFTTKAQELMARHAIDAALVWDRRREDVPATIRVPLDDPYMDAKSMLLTVVANESHCRAVIDNRHGLASVIGFEGDLVWCETLYTSLLVQAQRELSRAGAEDRAGGRRRSRSFRASFLIAYAHRIGERLAEVNAHVRNESAGVDEAASDAGGTGSGLLPVLARRRSAVDDAVDSQFGDLVTSPVRGGTDYLGWNAGHQAADRARLTRGELDARQAS